MGSKNHRQKSKKIKPGSLKAKNSRFEREVIGRIGKPQKTRRHRKIKKVDPVVTGKRSSSRDKRPKDDFQDPSIFDNQEVPKKVERYAKNKNKYKHMKTIPEIDRYDTRGAKKSLKPIPMFIQDKYEPDTAFVHRMEREADAVIAKTRLEEKYRVDLDEQQDGDILVKKRVSEKKKKKNLKRLQEKKEKKVKKRTEKLLDKEMSFDRFKDEVKFGEVAMQPPTLSSFPRMSTHNTDKPRPGKRSLLLKDILDKSSSDNMDKAKMDRNLGQCKKRKFMSPAKQLLIDNERERVVELYREMKKKRKPND